MLFYRSSYKVYFDSSLSLFSSETSFSLVWKIAKSKKKEFYFNKSMDIISNTNISIKEDIFKKNNEHIFNFPHYYIVFPF